MEKETSCINSRAILNYLKEHNVDCSSFFGDLDPEIDGLEDPEKFLRDPNNWISCAVISKLFKRAKLILHEEKAAYKMGRHASENISFGYAQRIVLKSFWSFRKALKNAQKINDKWNKSKKVELIELKKNQAIVRLYWNPETEVTKDMCLFNQGAYTYLPLVWGGRPPALKETCCYFDGAPYCEYHLKWPLTNKFNEIYSRFFTSKSVLTATIKEMERDKKIIEEKTKKLKNEIEERKQAEKALLESEKRYCELVNSITDFIYSHNLEGGFTTVNRAAAKTLGYVPEDLIGHPITDFMLPEHRQAFKEEYLAQIKEKGSIDGVSIYLAKDGSKHYIEYRNVLVKQEGMEPFVSGAGRDITEKVLSEIKVRGLQEQLQRVEKMEAIGTLAGGVAHDLNNILSGLVSYPELLLLEIPEDSTLRDPILTIQKSGEKAAAIVQDLLTLARRGVAVTEVVNLNQVINSYLRSPECENLKGFHSNAKIETDLETNLLNIMGSPAHLSKAIMNLVSNAAEAMPEEGTIFISTKNTYIDKSIRGYDNVKEGDYVVLTVSDTGIGISSEDMERIFEPFYTKKVMERSGTGLGMAVVWGTAKDHKGYIDVQSMEGKGSTFTIYFPVTRQELAKDKSLLSIEDYKGKGESILIVDDVEEQREIASRILIKLGYSVTSVASGEEAVDYMKDNTTDLLILDMIMEPGIDGFETYKRIIEFHPDQKTIIASGFSETERVKESQRLGAGQYIKKPYTLEKIGMAVKNELS